MSQTELVLSFCLFAFLTWIAGTWLTRAVDAIDARYHLGSAFGGLLFLGVATSLPEIAVVISAALHHHYDIIIGTLIGGVAIQTALLAILDARTKVRMPLTFSATSLTLVLEATIVILVTAASILAIKTPAIVPHTFLSLSTIVITGIWLFGLWLVYKSRSGLPWKVHAPGGSPGRAHQERQVAVNHASMRGASKPQIFITLAVCAGAILIAGVGLQSIGSQLASSYGISSGLFAATFIAFASALPDLSTGFSSIGIGDYQLAMSDIFGGNAFMPALFLVCSLVARHPILSSATPTDIGFAALGILLTGIYIIGLIVRPKRTFLRMGPDSLLVLVLYIVGVILLTRTG